MYPSMRWGCLPGGAPPGHPSPGKTPSLGVSAPRRPLKQEVRILLECTLVIIESTKDYTKHEKKWQKETEILRKNPFVCGFLDPWSWDAQPLLQVLLTSYG